MSELPEFARQRLRQQPAGDHPDADVLAAFSEHALTAGERERVLAHLAACGACREVVSLAATQEQEPVSSVAAAAPTRSSWLRWPVLRWPVLRWGAVALAAVFVVTGVALHLPELFRRPAAAKQETAAEVAAPAQTQPEAAPKNEAPKAKFAARPDVRPPMPQNKPDNAKEAAVARPRGLNAVAAEKSGKEAGGVGGVASGVVAGRPVAPVVVAEAKSKPAQALDAVHGTAGKPVLELSGAQSAAPAAAPARQRSEPASGAADQFVAPPPPLEAGQAVVARKGASLSLPRRVAGNGPVFVRWRVANDGSLEHLSGTGWEPAHVAANTAFRSVSAVGAEVWAAGSAGALFHSLDFGQTWKRVLVRSGEKPLSDDITQVEFLDALHGGIVTAAGERWTTADGGLTWTRQ